MKKYDKMLFLKDLEQFDWANLLSPLDNDLVSMTAKFKQNFESIINLHAPTWKKRVRSQFGPWLSVSLKNQTIKRDIRKQEAEKSAEPLSAYKRLRNQVTREGRSAITDYFNGLINENVGNAKKMWNTINKVLEKN